MPKEQAYPAAHKEPSRSWVTSEVGRTGWVINIKRGDRISLRNHLLQLYFFYRGVKGEVIFPRLYGALVKELALQSWIPESQCWSASRTDQNLHECVRTHLHNVPGRYRELRNICHYLQTDSTVFKDRQGWVEWSGVCQEGKPTRKWHLDHWDIKGSGCWMICELTKD